MNRFYVLLIAIVACLTGYAQGDNEPVKFRGGMCIHSGYLANKRTTEAVQGGCFGIGGKLSFTTGQYFRVGAEGYTSSLGYQNQDGYYKLNWGGLLMEYQLLHANKIYPVLGITLGGGKVEDMFFLPEDPEGIATDQIIFREYPLLICTPSLSAEYRLKSKLTLLLRLDYILPLFSEYTQDFAYGPRLYLGVLFNRR